MNMVDSEATLTEASSVMRRCGATELVVVSEAEGRSRPLGVLTATDIVVRVVAVGLDPTVVTAGDIASFPDVH